MKAPHYLLKGQSVMVKTLRVTGNIYPAQPLPSIKALVMGDFTATQRAAAVVKDQRLHAAFSGFLVFRPTHQHAGILGNTFELAHRIKPANILKLPAALSRFSAILSAQRT